MGDSGLWDGNMDLMIRPLPRATGREGGDRLVYRPVLARALVGACAVVGVGVVADLMVQGGIVVGALAGLWLFAAVAALACLFWRPAVMVDAEAVELRNVVRDVRVPWSCLDDVTTRYTLTLHVEGRRHQSWAGSASGRPVIASRLPDERWNPGGAKLPTSSRDLRADSGATAFMVEQAWWSWCERQGGGATVAAGDAGTTGGGTSDAGVTDAVEVFWRPVMPGTAVGAAMLAVVLGALLR